MTENWLRVFVLEQKIIWRRKPEERGGKVYLRWCENVNNLLLTGDTLVNPHHEFLVLLDVFFVYNSDSFILSGLNDFIDSWVTISEFERNSHCCPKNKEQVEIRKWYINRSTSLQSHCTAVCLKNTVGKVGKQHRRSHFINNSAT